MYFDPIHDFNTAGIAPSSVIAELSTNHEQRHALFHVEFLLIRPDPVIDIRSASQQFLENLHIAPQYCETGRAPAKLTVSSTPRLKIMQ